MKSKKKCSQCDSQLFARGYCIYHYKLLYLLPKERLKKKPNYFIKKITKHKSDINKLYATKREAFILSERNKRKDNKIFCIFCNREIHGDPSLHHGLGRDDDIILNEKYWYLSHNVCHVHIYHSIGWRKITWWNQYIERLKELNHTEMLNIEEKRMEK